MHFCDVLFCLGEMQILITSRLKQRACLVDPLGLCDFFVHSHFDIFYKRRGPKPRKGIEIWFRRPPTGAHSDQKKGPKGGHSGFG